MKKISILCLLYSGFLLSMKEEGELLLKKLRRSNEVKNIEKYHLLMLYKLYDNPEEKIRILNALQKIECAELGYIYNLRNGNKSLVSDDYDFLNSMRKEVIKSFFSLENRKAETTQGNMEGYARNSGLFDMLKFNLSILELLKSSSKPTEDLILERIAENCDKLATWFMAGYQSSSSHSEAINFWCLTAYIKEIFNYTHALYYGY